MVSETFIRLLPSFTIVTIGFVGEHHQAMCGNLDVAGVVRPWHQLLHVCSLLPLPLPPFTSFYFHGISDY